MPAKPTGPLVTERLILRSWREADRAPFAALNADPRVMEFFPAPLTAVESGALADRIETGLAQRGFGLWAVEVPGVADFIGFCGLGIPSFDAPFTPCVEIGWRIAHEYWGRGFAPEAARAALRFGFEEAELDWIVSFTAATNLRSRRVMEKIGLTRDPAEDFIHPSLPADHPLAPHVLYRIGADGRA